MAAIEEPPLRILVLVARDPEHPLAAGGDNHIALLAGQLADAGHEVTVWCASAPGLPKREDGRIRLRRLAPSRLLAPTVWAGLVAGKGRSYDLVLEEVIGGERIPFFASLLARRKAVGFWYQDNRPLFRASFGPVGYAIAARLQALLLRAYRSRALVVPSEPTRDWLASQGIPPESVAVHHPTVALRATDPPVPFRERRDRLVSIGKFRPLKRFEEAIDVLAALLPKVPAAELILLGREDDPEYLAGLRERARRLGVSERVTFRLNASEDEKYDTLRSAKALTIHSPVEGFGWTVPEAGLCGVPVVANVGTPSEVVVEGENGTRLPFGAVAEYARVLGSWMTDPATWEGFSKGARVHALRHARSELPAPVADLLRGWSRSAGDTPARRRPDARRGPPRTDRSPP